VLDLIAIMRRRSNERQGRDYATFGGTAAPAKDRGVTRLFGRLEWAVKFD
jgi:hypothetical protein